MYTSKTVLQIHYLLNTLFEEIHIVKDTPLENPPQHWTRPIHVLQPILLLVTPKLIIIHDNPPESRNNIHMILINHLHHLR